MLRYQNSSFLVLITDIKSHYFYSVNTINICTTLRKINALLLTTYTNRNKKKLYQTWAVKFQLGWMTQWPTNLTCCTLKQDLPLVKHCVMGLFVIDQSCELDLWIPRDQKQSIVDFLLFTLYILYVMWSEKTCHMVQNWYFELLESCESLNYSFSITFNLDLLWYWYQRFLMFKGYENYRKT